MRHIHVVMMNREELDSDHFRVNFMERVVGAVNNSEDENAEALAESLTQEFPAPPNFDNAFELALLQGRLNLHLDSHAIIKPRLILAGNDDELTAFERSWIRESDAAMSPIVGNLSKCVVGLDYVREQFEDQAGLEEAQGVFSSPMPTSPDLVRDLQFEFRRYSAGLSIAHEYLEKVMITIKTSISTSNFSPELVTGITSIDTNPHNFDPNRLNGLLPDLFHQMDAECLSNIRAHVEEAGRTLDRLRSLDPQAFRERALFTTPIINEVRAIVDPDRTSDSFDRIHRVVSASDEIIFSPYYELGSLSPEQLPAYINQRLEALIQTNRNIRIVQEEPSASSETIVEPTTQQPISSVGVRIQPMVGLHHCSNNMTTSIDLVGSILNPTKPGLVLRIENNSIRLPQGIGFHAGLQTSALPLNLHYELGLTQGKNMNQFYARSGISLPVSCKPIGGVNVNASAELGVIETHITTPMEVLPFTGLWKQNDTSSLYIGGRLSETKGASQFQQSMIWSLPGSKKLDSLTRINRKLTEINDDIEPIDTNETFDEVVPESYAYHRGVLPQSHAYAPSVQVDSPGMPPWLSFLMGAVFGGLLVYSCLNWFRRKDGKASKVDD